MEKKKLKIWVLFFVISILCVDFSSGCALKKEKTTALYIYMCGSTLETNGAVATENIKEILETNIPDDTTVVIETGGSKKWRNYDIAGNKLSRYVIENQELVLKETLDNASMGESDTLADFLKYCEKKYPAERKGVILWNHGNGGIGEVCYDQNYNMDSLSLDELSTAFEKSGCHYDMIGFDACLMATLDTTVAMSNYADYMIASEEIETGGGWDYKKVAEEFTSDKEMKDIGKEICDSYMKKCEKNEKAAVATLALIDLSKINEIKQSFNSFTDKLKTKANENYGNFEISNAVNDCTKFGGNSALEGYSNIIDLYNFSKGLDAKDDTKLCKALKDAVVYQVSGKNRKNIGGISLYYPITYSEKQVNKYISQCQDSEYKSYLEDIYTSVPKETVKFEDKGSIAEDGSFRIKLTPQSKKYVKSVEFCLIEFGTEGEKGKEKMKVSGLGIDNDIFKDWDNMEFNSNFRGVWLGLDGNLLSYSIVESNEQQVLFTAPVVVNGTLTNLRFSFIFDNQYPNGGYYQIVGLWNGLDENGMPSKDITPLKKGDKVTILTRQIGVGDYIESLINRNTITIGDDKGVISEMPLKEKTYQYVYVINDIFGNVIYSDTAVFEMQYSEDELKNNPLPDGKYAASILTISNNVDNEIAYGTMDY